MEKNELLLSLEARENFQRKIALNTASLILRCLSLISLHAYIHFHACVSVCVGGCACVWGYVCVCVCGSVHVGKYVSIHMCGAKPINLSATCNYACQPAAIAELRHRKLKLISRSSSTFWSQQYKLIRFQKWRVGGGGEGMGGVWDHISVQSVLSEMFYIDMCIQNDKKWQTYV